MEKGNNMIGNLFILGDSYSTYKDHIPEGYAFYYHPDVTDPPSVMTMELDETWWRRFIKATDANLVRNDSWSGSTISYTGYLGDCSSTSSFIYRYRTLRDGGFFKENRIDTLLIFGATNDSWVPSPLGEDREYTYEEDLYYVFPAITCLMSEMKKDLTDTRVVFIVNTELNEKIADHIKNEAKRLGVDTVALHDIEKIDGHPTPVGMAEICDQILTKIK